MTAPAQPPPTAASWTNTGRIACRSQNAADAVPVLTGADFRRLPIPAARVAVQPDPAAGPTLVNVPTNLYTAPQVHLLPTTVLGQPVRVRATPARYTWRYGDGTQKSTTVTGGPYPDLSTAHTYLRPGRYQVTLTTTYTGEYSVTAGPWQPVDGTADVTSPAVTVTARTAQARLTTPQP